MLCSENVEEIGESTEFCCENGDATPVRLAKVSGEILTFGDDTFAVEALLRGVVG